VSAVQPAVLVHVLQIPWSQMGVLPPHEHDEPSPEPASVLASSPGGAVLSRPPSPPPVDASCEEPDPPPLEPPELDAPPPELPPELLAPPPEPPELPPLED
jgi:hypothetical protein